LIVRTKNANDNAVPAGNGALVHVFARLWALTGQETYRRALDAQIGAFAGEIERNFYPLGTYLNGIDLALRTVQITILGARDASDTKALLHAVNGVSLPNRLIQMVAQTEALPANHPAAGKARPNGIATAYVCVGQTCSLPLSDPTALTAALSRI